MNKLNLKDMESKYCNKCKRTMDTKKKHCIFCNTNYRIMKNNNHIVRFFLDYEEIEIDGVKYTLLELKNKRGKSKFEVSILITMYKLCGNPIDYTNQLKLKL